MLVEDAIVVRVIEQGIVFPIIPYAVDILIFAAQFLTPFHLAESIAEAVVVGIPFRCIRFIEIAVAVVVFVLNAVDEPVAVAVSENGIRRKEENFRTILDAVGIRIGILGIASRIFPR